MFGKERRIERPRLSWAPRKVTAEKGVMARRARGRRAVRATWGSRLRSQRSFMVQPAPRIVRAPRAKRRVMDKIVVGGAI